jgi:septal ring factor EnvC (AmiA/AmiB activator)
MDLFSWKELDQMEKENKRLMTNAQWYENKIIELEELVNKLKERCFDYEQKLNKYEHQLTAK